MAVTVVRSASETRTPNAKRAIPETAERALVEAARSDARAFAALYEEYLPRIFRFLRVRVRSDEDAADLTQDVFVRAFAALPGYRDDGLPFAAWLFAIARNRSADAARRARSAGRPIPFDAAAASQSGDPEAAFLRREAIERVGVLLARLDADKQELVALRFAGGLSSREIAAVVGRSEAAVKQQLVRVLRTLKEQTR